MMNKRFSIRILGGGRKKEEMERVRLENERLQTVLQQQSDQQAKLMTQLAKEKADREYKEQADFERWEREERERVEELARKQKQRDDHTRKQRIISTESLAQLRNLIRERYALDIEIWGLRDVRKPDRPIAMAKMDKADAILHEIQDILYAWEDTRESWTDSEWEQAMEVKRRLLTDGKRWWCNGAPWDDVVTNGSSYVAPAW